MQVNELQENLSPSLKDLAAEYKGTVYLVGSALTGTEPRDIDLRLVIADAEFSKRYCEPHSWQEQGRTGIWAGARHQWAADCVKVSAKLTKQIGKLVDFMILPQMAFRMDLPYLVLVSAFDPDMIVPDKESDAT